MAKSKREQDDDELKNLATQDAEIRRLNRIEACKTYIEQTKLLVTLASAFIVAPAAVLALDPQRIIPLRPLVCILFAAECAFIVSVLAAYFVLGTLAGSQDPGTFDVYRPATMLASIVQLTAYLIGLGEIAWLVRALVLGAH